MFGYVRAFKPQMKICEYDTYKAVYCGLCKKLGKRFGFIWRMTLSYDFTFLAFVSMSMNDCRVTAKKERCIAHPFKKSFCAHCNDGLDYTADAAVILIYHKIRDDYADRGLKKRIAAGILLPFMKRGYKKAKALHPELAMVIEEQMKRQGEIEKSNTDSLDIACEPSSLMMQAIASEISDNENTKRILERFGYFLGRYVYMCDAIDDAPDDFKKHNYNPLLLREKFNSEQKELTEEQLETLYLNAELSLNMSLGELANAYVLMETQLYKPIIDNIIYLGLKSTFNWIKQKHSNRKDENDE